MHQQHPLEYRDGEISVLGLNSSTWAKIVQFYSGLASYLLPVDRWMTIKLVNNNFKYWFALRKLFNKRPALTQHPTLAFSWPNNSSTHTHTHSTLSLSRAFDCWLYWPSNNSPLYLPIYLSIFNPLSWMHSASNQIDCIYQNINTELGLLTNIVRMTPKIITH